MGSAIEENRISYLGLMDFTSIHLNERFDSVQQIAAHLRQQFEQNTAGSQPIICIPSAMELSDFYERSVLVVLDALFKLKKQRYEYRMNGLDGEIIIWDPTNRCPRSHQNPWLERIRPVNESTHRAQHIYHLLFNA